jgi:transglutaminase-like putative cysteine protease
MAEAASTAQRGFSFKYEVRVPPDTLSGANAHLWIPLPQSDAHQDITALRIESKTHYVRGRDPLYGDTFAMFTPTANEAKKGFDVVLSFHATRREYRVNVSAPKLQNASLALPEHDRMIQRYLEPDKLVPLNATIAELAKEHTAGATTPLEKARHIYEYVASTMRYDKSGEGWGHGDEMWACDSKRGNCTDFHSVFIGMMRSSGIPARFEIGFPLPEGKSEGDIPGYHCWAEFYINGTWIPVDASEASQMPAKLNYFFGSVDANRVMFTYGRDIQLSKVQKGEPLNYFVYPYAESDGKAVKGLQTHFSFRDDAMQAAAGAGR